MKLRVEDLKPGNVVRIDLVVLERQGPDSWFVIVPGDEQALGFLDDSDLAAGNAELVVRPRPVRKGDEIKNSGVVYTFLAYFDTTVIATPVGRMAPLPYDRHSWTHADGSPIDWEASE